MLNKRQIQLFTIYQAIVTQAYDPYSNRFYEVNPKIFSDTTVIKIDDMIKKLKRAKVFDRGSDLPAISQNGYQSASIEPKLLGLQMPISPLELLNVGVGITTINGQIVENTIALETNKLTEVKESIVQSLGEMSAEVYVTSKVKSLGLDFDSKGVSDKGQLTHSKAGDTLLAQEIVALIRAFHKAHKYFPTVTIGENVVNELLRESRSLVNANNGGYNAGFSSKTVGNVTTYEFKIDAWNLPIEVFVPINEFSNDGSEGAVIDTDDLIQLHHGKALAMAYAVLTTVDGSGKGTLVKGENVVVEGDVDKISGISSIGAFSAPVPMVVRPDLIERFELNLTA